MEVEKMYRDADGKIAFKCLLNDAEESAVQELAKRQGTTVDEALHALAAEAIKEEYIRLGGK